MDERDGDYIIERESWVLGWVDDNALYPLIAWYADAYTTEAAAIDKAKQYIGDSREITIAIAPFTFVTHKHYKMDDADVAELQESNVPRPVSGDL